MTLRLIALFSVFALTHSTAARAEDDYDVLDGRGKSGKKVQVIEWEGNLEIHVYPGGSLKGLALKLDDENKNKKVMIIAYRFDNDPQKQHVRRNVLSIPLRQGYKVFTDTSSGTEYDKVIITNNTLADLSPFRLDPEPKQLYPDGHPSLAKTSPKLDRTPSSVGAKKPQVFQDEDGAIKPFQW